MSTTNPTEFNKRLGAAVRARRIMAGLSQSAVGKTLGVTFQQIQKFEKGTNRLSTEALVIIAKAINTTPSQLLDDVDAANDIPVAVSPESMSDRMRLETLRRLTAMPADRQRVALKVIKALEAEEAA